MPYSWFGMDWRRLFMFLGLLPGVTHKRNDHSFTWLTFHRFTICGVIPSTARFVYSCGRTMSDAETYNSH